MIDDYLQQVRLAQLVETELLDVVTDFVRVVGNREDVKVLDLLDALNEARSESMLISFLPYVPAVL